jgi:hypothetical protein
MYTQTTKVNKTVSVAVIILGVIPRIFLKHMVVDIVPSKRGVMIAPTGTGN